MSTERWRDRVRKAWQDVDEARKWRQRVDDNDAEERVKGATENFWRALVGQPPMPPEVREAQRRLDEFCEDHPYALDDDPILMERDQQLQQQVTDAECSAGIHTSCRHRHQWRKPSDSPPPDDGEVSGDWFAEQRAKTWGVIQPDGTVVAKGFLGDADAQEDMAVHPPGAIAVHGASGWTNAATGHPAGEGPARRPDEDPLSTEPETAMTEEADLRNQLREMDDEDLEHEKRNTGELQEMAEDDGDTERAARLGRDYADFEAEQHRREAEAARTLPPEPPVGTVLETHDDFTGDYRIERTDDGWRQQYHDGESPDGSRTSPTFGGRGISWRAAWSAWGPPSGAEPFREVPANSPLLPAYPDASGDRLVPPPAAEPYVPPTRTGRQVCEPPKTTPPTDGTTTGSTGGEGTPDVHDRRVGRWYDDKPITSTNTTPTGGSMPSIDEARATIMAGIEKENEGLGALQSAKASLEDAQNMLMQGTEGSNQAESDQAHAQLADAMSKIDEACQQVASTLQEFESVANRL